MAFSYIYPFLTTENLFAFSFLDSRNSFRFSFSILFSSFSFSFSSIICMTSFEVRQRAVVILLLYLFEAVFSSLMNLGTFNKFAMVFFEAAWKAPLLVDGTFSVCTCIVSGTYMSPSD